MAALPRAAIFREEIKPMKCAIMPSAIQTRLVISLLIAAFAGWALPACAPGQAEMAPPDIVYGETPCVECSMIISDARFAAGYAHEVAAGRYESKAFDDIGDMLVHAGKHAEDKITAWYVHDYVGEAWLDAEQAIFVVSPQLPTPMGYGILAFAERSAAERVAAEAEGELLTWEELRQEAKAGIGHGHAHGGS